MTSGAESLEGEIRDLLAMILKLPPPPPADFVRGSVPQWDSLKHMEVIFALEDRYGVRFDESEFAALISPMAIAKALHNHLAA
ncbi:MAG: acyl carrier protein [Betaproteobacteria bacterium]|nr:MAG: acyl carrier protein [Betaproteobacteria bacterium]